MHNETGSKRNITLMAASNGADAETAERIRRVLGADLPANAEADHDLILKLDAEGLALISEGQVLRGDFTRILPRLRPSNLSKELLVRAAKIKNPNAPLMAIDATAGLGEDSFLLAAAGFHVTLYERNPIIFLLLNDALRRASDHPELAELVARMQLFHADSIHGMKQLEAPPDVILLDPMFPARQKSALVKKKLQIIQKLEFPCSDENELLLTAMNAKPKKLIIKRPPKGPYLAGMKPDYSITGKAVRFDCIVSPYDKLGKFPL